MVFPEVVLVRKQWSVVAFALVLALGQVCRKYGPVEARAAGTNSKSNNGKSLFIMVA
jgi:hypothetical protein